MRCRTTSSWYESRGYRRAEEASLQLQNLGGTDTAEAMAGENDDVCARAANSWRCRISSAP